MMRRTLALALVAALFPAAAQAQDLLQAYQLARAGDPQFAAAESSRLATREGAVQARAALLPQLNGTATYNHSRSTGPATQTFSTVDGAGNPILQNVDGDSSNTSNSPVGRFKSHRMRQPKTGWSTADAPLAAT